MKNWIRASSMTRTASTLSTCPPTLMSRNRAWISHSNRSPIGGPELLAQPRLGAVLRADALLVGVEGADEVHVGADVAGRVEARADPQRAGRAVDEAQADRQTGLLGDLVE